MFDCSEIYTVLWAQSSLYCAKEGNMFSLMPLFHFLFLFSSPSSSFSPYFRRFGRPPDPPPSPRGTCRTVNGMSAYRPGLLIPSGSKIMTGVKLFTSYKIMTCIIRFFFSNVCPPDKILRTDIKSGKELKNQKQN